MFHRAWCAVYWNLCSIWKEINRKKFIDGKKMEYGRSFYIYEVDFCNLDCKALSISLTRKMQIHGCCILSFCCILSHSLACGCLGSKCCQTSAAVRLEGEQRSFNNIPKCSQATVQRTLQKVYYCHGKCSLTAYRDVRRRHIALLRS